MHTDPLPESESTALFQYLRALVNTAEATEGPYARFALVEAYWNIGRIIVEIELKGQERAEYGLHLIESLSAQLTLAFGKGYSLPNMWRFKQFFLAFQILSTDGRELPNLKLYLRHELKWSHYRFLMKLEDEAERNFYIHKAADEGWTVRFMQRMINMGYYHKVKLGDTHLLPTPTQGASASPTLSLLGGTTRTRLANLKKILLERHIGYAFVGQRQYINISGKDDWVELVFFHYLANRFVLIKLGEHDSTTVSEFTALLNAYESKQPPTTSKPPLGFLINQKAENKLVMVSQELGLPLEESVYFPLYFL